MFVISFSMLLENVYWLARHSKIGQLKLATEGTLQAACEVVR